MSQIVKMDLEGTAKFLEVNGQNNWEVVAVPCHELGARGQWTMFVMPLLGRCQEETMVQVVTARGRIKFYRTLDALVKDAHKIHVKNLRVAVHCFELSDEKG